MLLLALDLLGARIFFVENGTISHVLLQNFRSLGTTQFQEKRSRSEKAILGALGEFRGILGAALRIRNSILGVQNSILGRASHDLSNTKTTILGATLGAIPGIGGSPHERFSFAPPFSERFFENWGGPRAQENWPRKMHPEMCQKCILWLSINLLHFPPPPKKR